MIEVVIGCLLFVLWLMRKIIKRNLIKLLEQHNYHKQIQHELSLSIDDVFNGFIGNEGAVSQIKRELRYARLHNLKKIQPLGLFGPPSTGKTELAKRIARALGLPILVLSKSTLSKEENFFNEVSKEIENLSDGMLVAPPMVIFLDEAHVLSGRVQDSLLTALENDDRCFRSNAGDIDTQNITFIIATTDPGKLRSAFRSRLYVLNLVSYSLEEIVKILKHRREHDSNVEKVCMIIPDDALTFIAKAGRGMPRRAIELMKAIGKAISLKDVEPTLEAIQSDLWRTLACDKNGLLDIDRKYLCFLSERKAAGLRLLSSALGLDKDNIEHMIEPWLIQNGLIECDRSGRKITPKGSLLMIGKNNAK